MLSRLVRIQLVIFTIASIIGVVTMVFAYMQVPTLLGIGKITVTLELPASGGLYRFANVTYRGVQVGKVTAMDVSRTHATATLRLDTSPKIPADLRAEVRSVSAVGEQYVELLPRTDQPPYLEDGSVIPMSHTTIPQPVSPMLEQLNTLIGSIPAGQLSALIDDSYRAFDGAGYDMGSLIDSSAALSGELNRDAGRSAALIEDSMPLLDAQSQSTDALRLWARSLAGVTDQVVTNDPQVRTLLTDGPPAADEATALLEQVKPTLPVLLANMTTFGQVAVTYRPSLEQVLVLLPPFVANVLSSAPENNPTGIPLGDFRIQMADPNPCTVGFLPPSAWRSPDDTTTLDTPDGLYCKLPQDSPIVVRGARNAPCMGVPGKRAPTVELCYSDEPYRPLAMRQHSLGPYPFDPNLIRQGVPPDDRVTADENLFAPLEGTPLPPGAVPGPAAAPPGLAPPEPPVAAAPPGPPALTPVAPAPSVAIAHYDPETGRYATPDGNTGAQTDLVNKPQSWQDMVYPGGVS
ncbi:MCE-family protein [Mycolicibacterium phlei]|uniref:Virulence factor Mce n=3 Tax=Mycolicibacterium phlei TaxID=1771 RepID=A0A5N5V1B9_MYCPH|nr:MlaD family protein [Mycolicibacterium phlei]VEG09056.1 MCE-family protein [Mycobacteroides chelonae]AMO60940.1 mce related protein [Mycolicibacterium phlei]EID18288.1 mce-family protein mce1f [Mycolicibacterium phlei RIVM601174]KAB7754917.1 virulence factor Mce [Mycolicibacterium phlei DSM 43239 = CCUG 21000]KXW64602.1 virulence factor Mce [Mycolicibacterium phlei DSM 43239 = CCUG 21000]